MKTNDPGAELAAFYGVDLPNGVPAEQQERAYMSPI
jgi:hypothetical protein